MCCVTCIGFSFQGESQHQFFTYRRGHGVSNGLLNHRAVVLGVGVTCHEAAGSVVASVRVGTVARVHGYGVVSSADLGRVARARHIADAGAIVVVDSRRRGVTTPALFCFVVRFRSDRQK